MNLLKIYQQGSFTIHPAVPIVEAYSARKFVEKNTSDKERAIADREHDFTTWCHSNILFIYFILLNTFGLEAVLYFCFF